MLEVREPTTGPKSPTGRELAAILAAYDAVVHLRPNHEEEATEQTNPSWRFANRWWNRSNVRDRGRPTRPGSFS